MKPIMVLRIAYTTIWMLLIVPWIFWRILTTLWKLSTKSFGEWRLMVLLMIALWSGGIAARSWRQMPSSNFVGDGTHDLTTSILKNSAKGDYGGLGNYVFSPLGYSTILAILAEGARGDTRNQLVATLHLPEDTFAVRNTYKKLLASMQERGVNRPEFKNWFYVYKNYSVEESYKSILAENYLTQVRHIEFDMDSESPEEPEEQLPAIGEEKNKEKKPENVTEENPTVVSFEEKQQENLPPAVGEAVSPAKATTEAEEPTSLPNVKKVKRDGRSLRRKRSVFRFSFGKGLGGAMDGKSREVLTALSANRLCTIVKSETEKNPKAKMIIFNGLYFRGNWSNPFTEEEGSFYTASGEKRQVPIVQSTSEYYVARLPHLDSTAIELPYQGERYSLLIVLPNSKDGLPKLTSILSGQSFTKIDKQLSKKEVEVFLPKFKFYTISHPKEALIKSGVRDIFDQSADLSGISGAKGLYLDDLVQLVTLEVDDGSSRANFLTSSKVTTRNNLETFRIDHPFLFFLRDRVENLIVVAGRLTDPSIVN